MSWSLFFKEDRLAAIAPRGDVVRTTGCDDAGETGHGGSVAETEQKGNIAPVPLSTWLNGKFLAPREFPLLAHVCHCAEDARAQPGVIPEVDCNGVEKAPLFQRGWR
jgi:hypothetical protein